ncbi:MAG: phosphoenolpyruvate--protein phosphotransferase [Deltaproteobacteria bacterium]|nr:phosphoenolpyruvate--protein phosphotransferase [Deltaproteobacteria bacterium]
MDIAHNLVRLNAHPATKEDAIRQAGQLLVAAGCVGAEYTASMVRRESVANTFLGHGVAIPHGLGEDRNLVQRDGIAVLQVPGGVEWSPGQTARLIVGIAAQSDSHLAILKRLTRLIQDEARLEALFTTGEIAVITNALTADAIVAATTAAVDLAHRATWVVSYPNGLHARPATAWVEAARSAASRIQVRRGAEAADARNLVALLQLGLAHGDEVVLSASGADAAAALARFHALVESLAIGERADAQRAAERAARPVRGWQPPKALRAITGIAASPGLAIGAVHVLAAPDAAVPDRPAPLGDGAAALTDAIARTRQQLTALQDATARRLGASDARIFAAQAALLDDTDLITLTCQRMVAGHGVAWAWHEAVERTAAQLAALANPVLAARAADLRDVGRRVVVQLEPALAGGTLAALPDGPTVIVAADLSPSDTANLDPQRIVGLATAQGGPTSHTAILARTLGLPALVAGGAPLLALASGTPVIVDGDTGRLYLAPDDADLASARAWIASRAEIRAAESAVRGEPARTLDGHAIAIGANVNAPDQVPLAIAQGGEGVGLMRTEFLFLERGATPTEDEQHDTYRGMIDALDGRPLIVRALDIGGDKQVAHLDLPREDNPFLGVRGARLLLRRADLLDPQLRALYRAARAGGDLSIMFPMVTSVGEVLALRAHCERIRAEVDGPVVPLGIMIEVPAAALLADALSAHVDFFSIGTNDLTQYALAIDRQNPELAAEADSLHPAVLRLIELTVKGAARHARWVGVCGGIAGDPFGAALLAGLGVSELSMTPREIPAVKARLRASTIADLRALAARALAAETAAQVRALDGGAS